MAPKRKPISQLKKTAKYYRKNPKAAAKKKAYDTKFESTPERKAIRASDGRKRYAAKKAGKNIKGKDYDRRTGRFVDSSTNRGAKEKSRLKGSKRKKR